MKKNLLPSDALAHLKILFQCFIDVFFEMDLSEIELSM